MKSVDFWLSAPMRMRVGGVVTRMNPTLQNEVLALLLIRANVAVPVTEIAASVWPDPRRNGIAQIRPYISKLRGLLDGTGVTLENRRHRYELQVDPMRVDVLRFRRLLADADETTDENAQRTLTDDALATCPADALLGDFTRSWAHTLRSAHRATWEVAALRRNSYWLRDGRHHQLLNVLRRTGVANSKSPAWVDHYLQTLYRCGLANEAIAHYEAFERHLRERHEQVPDRLRRLADAIRRRDRKLDPPGGRPTSRPASDHLPNMLPPPRGGLVGRHSDVYAMRVHAARDVRDAVRVVGIYGAPGIGKTALATTYAHSHEARYPGGVLYADMGTYGLGGRLEVTTVLAAFLGAMGVTGDQLPADLRGRRDRYRDLTRRDPFLVVLDNADSTDSVSELLPTAPGSLVVVTSRQRLTSLTSRYGALAVVLDRLDEDSAVTLLKRFIEARPDLTDELVRAVARACDGHPLALCLAGARIATRPEEPLSSVAAALASPAHRIPALDRYAEAGDAVADVFGWSYRTLDPGAAWVFRMFGGSPCPSLDLPAASHLAGMSVEAIGPVLAELEAGHLVTKIGDDRYAMLDLIAEYAADLAADTDSADERNTALSRLYEHHRRTARAAAHCLWPSEVDGSDEWFSDPATARHWLDSHRDDLIAAALHPAGQARPRYVLDLAAELFRYLDHGGHLDQALRLDRAAVAAAESLGDAGATARALNRRGAVLIRLGRSDAADAALTSAYAMYSAIGDRNGQAVVLGNRGRAALRRGDHEEAAARQSEAVELFRTSGNLIGEARTLTNLGWVREAQGDLAAALRHYEDARAICLRIDAPDALARALGSIASVHRAQARFDEARRLYQAALETFRRLGDRIGEATTLTNLGITTSTLGAWDEAVSLHELALGIFEEIGDQANATETLNNLGTTLLAGERPAAAASRLGDALGRAEDAHDRTQMARAHAGLAIAYSRLVRAASVPGRDELTRAQHHLDEAVDRYGELGLSYPSGLRELMDQPTTD